MYNGVYRYDLRYNGSSLYTSSFRRDYGRYVRCVSEEKDVSDLTYMQDMTASSLDTLVDIKRLDFRRPGYSGCRYRRSDNNHYYVG
ncbi:hypothetical protein IKF84_00110 [Candidatus Saccharibacteria bacterium]|nr:hypothetical protein [Candidatus Saccharibacteria bacterium]